MCGTTFEDYLSFKASIPGVVRMIAIEARKAVAELFIDLFTLGDRLHTAVVSL